MCQKKQVTTIISYGTDGAAGFISWWNIVRTHWIMYHIKTCDQTYIFFAAGCEFTVSYPKLFRSVGVWERNVSWQVWSEQWDGVLELSNRSFGCTFPRDGCVLMSSCNFGLWTPWIYHRRFYDGVKADFFVPFDETLSSLRNICLCVLGCWWGVLKSSRKTAHLQLVDETAHIDCVIAPAHIDHVIAPATSKDTAKPFDGDGFAHVLHHRYLVCVHSARLIVEKFASGRLGAKPRMYLCFSMCDVVLLKDLGLNSLYGKPDVDGKGLSKKAKLDNPKWESCGDSTSGQSTQSLCMSTSATLPMELKPCSNPGLQVSDAPKCQVCSTSLHSTRHTSAFASQLVLLIHKDALRIHNRVTRKPSLCFSALTVFIGEPVIGCDACAAGPISSTAESHHVTSDGPARSVAVGLPRWCGKMVSHVTHRLHVLVGEARNSGQKDIWNQAAFSSTEACCGIIRCQANDYLRWKLVGDLCWCCHLRGDKGVGAL